MHETNSINKPTAHRNDNADMQAQVKAHAIKLLSRREYAEKELYDRFCQKGFSTEVIHVALEELKQNNYLSNERYADMLVRSRAAKRYGPRRIRQELSQNGISSCLSAKAFDENQIDWYQLAYEAREKKYGEWQGGEYKEKAKQMRFLASRGFEQDQIEAAFT